MVVLPRSWQLELPESGMRGCCVLVGDTTRPLSAPSPRIGSLGTNPSHYSSSANTRHDEPHALPRCSSVPLPPHARTCTSHVQVSATHDTHSPSSGHRTVNLAPVADALPVAGNSDPNA